VDRAAWTNLLGLAPHEVPRLLVLEGTWWRERALADRLPLLDGVRELGMPDLWHGWHDGVPVAYCPAYGAARAVEPVHALGTLGTRVVVQIGSCGGLQPYVRTGELVLAETATIGEGASQYYGGHGVASANMGRVVRASSLLAGRDVFCHRGRIVTTDALLAQPPELVARWRAAGHLAVDMETSAVFSAASAFGMRAASLLFVWDELPGRTFADPFTPEERAAQDRASRTMFEIALALA